MGRARGVANVVFVSAGRAYDLTYDPNDVDGDLVVECWISHGSRASDSTFDPQVGDALLVGDEEEPPLSAVVVRRDSNRVWVRLDINVFASRPSASSATA